MFSIDKKQENGFEKIILKDNATNTYAAILPGCGAVLHFFIANNYGESFNVIDSYETAGDFMNHHESKGFLGSKLSPFVCRLKHGTYRFGEKKYKMEKFYLGKNAIHGILYDKVFAVTGETANASRFCNYEI